MNPLPAHQTLVLPFLALYGLLKQVTGLISPVAEYMHKDRRYEASRGHKRVRCIQTEQCRVAKLKNDLK